MTDNECVTVNIYKEGTKTWTGSTKIVTIIVVKDGLEENLNKNVMALRTPEPNTPEPETKINDLHFPPTHTFEITGYIKDIHQVLTTSAVTSGTGKTINLETGLGLSAGDSLTIASPNFDVSETIIVSSVGTNSIVADLANDYPSGSLVTLEGLNAHTLKEDLIKIFKDTGVATLVYRNNHQTFAFSKINFRDEKTKYYVKMSIIIGNELI